jgi:hypothetical protein
LQLGRKGGVRLGLGVVLLGRLVVARLDAGVATSLQTRHLRGATLLKRGREVEVVTPRSHARDLSLGLGLSPHARADHALCCLGATLQGLLV